MGPAKAEAATPPPVAKRRGLGMGLSALLGEAAEEVASGNVGGGGGHAAPQRVPIEFLSPSPFQPRRRFDEEELDALAASLREHGVLQPLLVRPVPRGAAGYEIVAGERRWRAAQRAGLDEVPVVVRELGDRATLELALVENVQRADLTPLEEADAFRRLIDDFGHTQEALAEAVGRSRSHVANTLRLLGLPPAVRDMLADGRLTAGHARALLGSRDPGPLAARVVAEGLSVRQAEDLVRHENAATTTTTATVAPGAGQEVGPSRRAVGAGAADAADLERELTQRLGLEVALRSRGRAGGGMLTIRWRDQDQLSHLLERLR